MISIDRSALVTPSDLADGAIDEFPQLARKAAAGTIGSADFKTTLYSSEEVRVRLWNSQHHKCCFCEQKLEWKFATVEHFRPKTSVRRADGRRLKPGYWWLAYELDNLYFACSNCNSPKSDWFPLEAGASPLAEGELPGSRDEKPLVLDPGRDIPEDHLVFIASPAGGFQIAPLEGSDRGAETVRRLDLDRDALSDLRNEYAREDLLPLVERFRGAIASRDVAAERVAREEARARTGRDRRFSLLARAVLAELL